MPVEQANWSEEDTDSVQGDSNDDWFGSSDEENNPPLSQRPATPNQVDQVNDVQNNVQNIVDNISDKNDEVLEAVMEVDIKEISEKLVKSEYGCDDISTIKSEPVTAALAETLNVWLRTCPNKMETKTLFQNCLVPENVEALNPTRINDLLFPRLSFRAKEADKKLKVYNTFLSRAIGPLVSIWDMFIAIEAQCQKNSTEIPAFIINNKVITTKDMQEKLVYSIKLLSACNAIMLQKRRVAIRPHLDLKYQPLTKPSNPITKWLLGDNIEQKMTNLYRVSQATRRKSNFLVRNFNDKHKSIAGKRFGKFRPQFFRNNNFSDLITGLLTLNKKTKINCKSH